MIDYTLDLVKYRFFDHILSSYKWPGVYSKEVKKSIRDDESAIYSSVNLSGQAIMSVKIIPESIITTFDILTYNANEWPNSPLLGYRKLLNKVNDNAVWGEYQWYSYKEVCDLVKTFGTALCSYNGGVAETVVNDCTYVKSAKFVGIFAKNSPKWLMIDFACSAYKLVSVPLYETFGIKNILHIANQTELTTICIDSAKLQLLYENQDSLVHLKLIITLDEISKDNEKYAKKLKFTVITFDTLIKMYENKVIEPFKSTCDDLSTIIYTSGTTGIPKGAVFTHRTYLNHILRYISTGNRLYLHMGVRVLSFLPLAHVYQRFIEHAILFFRCQIGYYTGDIKNILSDIQTLKPTFIIGVPRIFNKIHAKISQGIAEKSRIAQYLANKAIQIRARSFRERVCPIKLFFANLILSKVTKLMGGNLITMVTGSALLNKKVAFEIQGMLGAILTEGWGMTECGFTFVREGVDTDFTIIGGPLGAVQFKLRSLPDLNYFVTDNPPKNKELTASTLDKEGWLSTGDVVEITPSKGVRIIDRAKCIFKLSQGEYIAPDKLENAYITVELVEQIYVHGQSDKAFVVAIVVVTPETIDKWKKAQTEPNKSKLDSMFESELLDRFDQVAKNNDFNPLERIRRAHVTTNLFTIENGLITPTMKNIRRNIAEFYKVQIEEMYKSLENCVSVVKF